MKNHNIFFSILSKHEMSMDGLVGLLTLISIACIWSANRSRFFRISAAVGTLGLGIAANFGLTKWLITLSTISSGFKIPKRHVIDYINNYVSTSVNYILQPEIGLQVLSFYALVALAIVLSIRTVRVRTSNQAVRSLVYAMSFIVATFCAFGLTLPLALILMAARAHRPQTKTRLLSGNEVFDTDGRSAVFRLKDALKKQKCDGIHIHSDVRIPRAMESTHFLLIGSQGSGKSNAIHPMIAEILARGDKMIAYDFKGDLSARHGEDTRVAILSPFDARSRPWHVAKDIRTQIDAEEFAKMICPDNMGHQDFFALAARDLIVGCISKLQVEKEFIWTFSDLYSLVSDDKRIEAACLKHRVEALQMMKDEDGGRQTAGILGEIRNRTRNISYLAKAWPTATDGISISEWLTDTTSKTKMIIIQSNPRYSELDKFFTVQIYSFIFKEVLSFSDSRERRIWAAIDEFPTLPRIADFSNTLRAGRSKGLCVIAAIQDFGRIKRTYEKDGGLEEFCNGFGLKLAGKLNNFETEKYVSQLCGQQILEKTNITFTKQKDAGYVRTEHPPVKETVDAVPPEKFSKIPYSSLKVPAEFYLIGCGPIVKLQYPIEPVPEYFPKNVEPTWMSKLPLAEFKEKQNKLTTNDKPTFVTLEPELC